MLAIVDPDTNQAIKVEKATSSNANASVKPAVSNVKVEPPASRPLHFSDPTEAKPSEHQKSAMNVSVDQSEVAIATITEETDEEMKIVSGATSTEKDMEPKSIELESVSKTEPAVNSAVENIKDSGVSLKSADIIPSVEKATSSVVQDVPTDKKSIDQQDIMEEPPKVVDDMVTNQADNSMSTTNNKTDDNLDGMTSDVSSSTFADVRSESTDGPLPNLSSKNSNEQPQNSVTKTTGDPAHGDVTSETTKFLSSQEPNIPETHTGSVIKTEEPSSDALPSAAKSAGMEDPISDKVSSETTEKEATEDEQDSAVKDVVDVVDAAVEGDQVDENVADVVEDISTTRMVFKDGERKQYPYTWLFSKSTDPNTKKISEFQQFLSSTNILKDGGNNKRSNPRDNHVGRSGSGSMSSDPRGRTFPPPMQFTMPTIRGPAPLIGSAVGSDLNRARSQPPPMLKSKSSGRDGDPRGFRTQPVQGGRHGGPVRYNHAVDPYANMLPVEKLKRADNAWKRDQNEENDTTKKVMEVRSLLNKLTLEKFDKIFLQIVEIDISSMDALIGIVKEIFEKPLYEPKFSSMYAELCRRLDQTIQPVLDRKDPDGHYNFKKILLNNCKEEFVRFANSSANKENDIEKDPKSEKEDSKPPVEGEETKEAPATSKEEEEMKAVRAKRRMLANVRFIGELYLKDLLRENIIHKNCIQKLLTLASESYEEEVLEAVCKLISKTGGKLSTNRGAAEHINQYFRLLSGWSRNIKVPARIRFMIQDLVEQRANNWKVRREEVGAKTIAEIHKDIEEKEKVKQEAASALRDRKHRMPGSRMHGDRSGMSSQPRIAMTMASPKVSSSGMSRTNMALERAAQSRASANTSASLQGVRLGPGAKSALSVGGTPLRPRSMSGSRFSALGSDPQERTGGSTSNVGGGTDPRRTKLAPNSKPNLPRRAMSSRVDSNEISRSLKVMSLMDPVALKKKAKSILEEYLEIELFDEFIACMEEEIRKPNYPALIENLVKVTMEGKKDVIPKTQKLFGLLLKSGKISASMFLGAFEKYGPELLKIEVDFPLATELFCGLVPAISSTDEFKELEGNGKYGIGFVRRLFDDAAEKNGVSKLVVNVCRALMVWEKNSKSEDEAKQYALAAYRSLNIDISAEMNAWDDMFGAKMLRTMLSRANVEFLIPSLEVETEVKSILEQDAKEEAVCKVLQASKVDMTVEDVGVEVVRSVIRVALNVVFCEEAEVQIKLESILKQCVGKSLLRQFKGENVSTMPKAHQFGSLCAVQGFFARNESKLPAMIGEQRSAWTVFMALYDGDIVEEDVFRMWKDDTDVSVKIPGKEKILLDTSKFYKWLDEAEEE